MNPDEIDFEKITPTAKSRPEKCVLCTPENDSSFGRLNFANPDGSFSVQYCPMHKQDIKDGKLTYEQIALRYTGGKIA